jgi:glycine cleavage system H protein
MSSIPKDLLYTKDHEWVKPSSAPGIVVVGVTDFAQNSLGDVTFLQLPEVGRVVKKGDVFGTVESVKAVSDLYAPVSGTVVKINQELVQTPDPINRDPYGAWMIEIQMSVENEKNSLLNAEAYAQVAQ